MSTSGVFQLKDLEDLVEGLRLVEVLSLVKLGQYRLGAVLPLVLLPLVRLGQCELADGQRLEPRWVMKFQSGVG
jgi:hypothetical protein